MSELKALETVAALHALPESDPIEADGIGFHGNQTCQQQCVAVSVNVIQTVCAIFASCN
jgi:hypothetical protein